MMKRFLSLIAVLAISLLTACAQTPVEHPMCKSCPTGMDCCGACPCGNMGGDAATAASEEPAAAKMGKHHHHHHHAAAAAAAKDTKAKDAAAPTIPNQEKSSSVIEGVKKIIKDVKSKDIKKPE